MGDFTTWSLLYLASEWVIRLIMLVYVPQRRSPAAARTWLLLIFLFPWPGLVLYGILGRVYLPRLRIEMQEMVSGFLRDQKAKRDTRRLAAPELQRRFDEAATLAESLGDFAVTGGNSFELLTDYHGSIDRLVDDIDNAREHVHLLYYIFNYDGVGQRVLSALKRAAARGVKCRLLLDGLGSKQSLPHLEPELTAAGVELTEILRPRLFRRQFFRRTAPRFDLRNHRKLTIVDGTVAHIGSQNIADPDFIPGKPNEELVARATGPVVSQLQAVFAADRYFETGNVLFWEELFPASTAAGGAAAQVVPSSPGYQRENAHHLIVDLIHRARERVVLTTPYFIPDEPLLLALEIAALRGLNVCVILSKANNQLIAGFAQKSYYEQLLEAGVKIYHYLPGFLHAKHLTIDDYVSLIGSSNFDIRSFALNAEVSCVIYDVDVNRRLQEIERRYLANSDELSRERWQRRPWTHKLAQDVARLADALL